MADVTQTTRFRFWLWLIRLIGVIVPRRLRTDWRQEWEAELRHREALLAEWDRLTWGSKLNLLWRSTSAFWDALWLQTYRWEDAMIQDLRFGARMLLKQPGFTFIAVLTLALGIGANTTIFSAIESVILHPFSFPNQNRLVVIYERKLDAGINRAGITPGSLHDLREQSHTFEQFVSLSGGFFDLTGTDKPERALVMATLGLYAVMSFVVAQRTHEIGIRMALGAQTRDVFVIVIKQGLRLVSLGVIIGLIGAFAVTRLLSQMLFGLTPSDPITYATVTGLLLATAFVACIVPARHATRVDPLVALRHE